MIEKIQHATASSPEGAKGLVKGVLACAFQNMAFMLPTGLLYLLVKDLLAGSTSGRSTFYLLGCVACFALILLTTWFQYNGTYFTTYKESGTRRLTLAERLRKLPLSFFGKRDLADLTSTIMADCGIRHKGRTVRTERPVCPDVAGVSGFGAVEGCKGGVRND